MTVSAPFEVSLDVFSGPFDLLLSLIAKQELDVTEVALAQVTDDFLAYIQRQGSQWDLDEASEFLVIAATLLDAKVARLLPAEESDDDTAMQLLEARDVLYARLLQYRAFRDVSGWFETQIMVGQLSHARSVSLEPEFKNVQPELKFTMKAAQFAELAAGVLARPFLPEPNVSIEHIHRSQVNLHEQAVQVADRLRVAGVATFAELVSDAGETLEVVARFIALLEFFRARAVSFDQPEPLGVLTVEWIAQPGFEVPEELGAA